MTSESSLDSSSERSLDSSSPSAGPSRKRCRSPTTLVPSSTPVSRSIALALADLLPRKSDGVRAPTKDGLSTGFEVATSDIREDEEEFKTEARDALDLEGTLYDISHYMSEVPLDRITEFKIAQRQLEADKLVASGERASLADRVRSLGQENLRVRALLCIERDRVDSLRRHMALSQEEFCQIYRDRDDTRRRLRRLESLVEMHLGFPC
ncbi:hypothetical protein Tco_0916983 [Tanacetum coccineum]